MSKENNDMLDTMKSVLKEKSHIHSMLIDAGFNDKPTEIRLSVQSEQSSYLPTKDRCIEVWIYQKGLSEKETLSYMTLGELLDLKDEVDIVLKGILSI